MGTQRAANFRKQAIALPIWNASQDTSRLTGHTEAIRQYRRYLTGGGPVPEKSASRKLVF